MPLSLLNHSALALFAQRTRIPASARSIGFCVIWVCIRSSSSSPMHIPSTEFQEELGEWNPITRQQITDFLASKLCCYCILLPVVSLQEKPRLGSCKVQKSVHAQRFQEVCLKPCRLRWKTTRGRRSSPRAPAGPVESRCR